jgi:prevent-host-death family protein
MPFINVKGLHDRTSEVLRQAEAGEPVFITRFGKPIAVLREVTQDELEGLALLTHPTLRRELESARQDAAAGRVTPLANLIAEAEKERKRTP